MKSFIFLPLLFVFQCKAQNSSVTGTWIGSEDKKSILKIDKANFSEFYGDRNISSHKYAFSSLSCDSTYLKKDKKGNRFIKLDDGTCYEVTGVTDSTLALRYTNTGHLLRFRK